MAIQGPTYASPLERLSASGNAVARTPSQVGATGEPEPTADVIVSPGVTEVGHQSDRQEAVAKQHLAAIRTQIGSGTYQINSHKVAQRLLDEESAWTPRSGS